MNTAIFRFVLEIYLSKSEYGDEKSVDIKKTD
jgi:hypothetical protein